jgi:hypothetical protein
LKWTLIITDIDLGELIPTEDELKPHDHPIESWASEVLGSLLNDLHTHKLDKVLKAHMEPNEAINKALIQGLTLDAKVAEHLAKNIALVRQDEEN